MFIGVGVWLVVGAIFGYFRARDRYTVAYREAQREFPMSARNDLGYIKRTAFAAATVEFLKWIALGLISGLSFLAWIILQLMLATEIDKRKIELGDAIVLSIVIFVLGALALTDTTEVRRRITSR